MRLLEAARRIVGFWNEVDVVLTPTLALPPVPIGWQHQGVDGAIEQLRRNTVFTPFTAVANLTGLPAMSLPLHRSSEGLPIGVQAIGAPGRRGATDQARVAARGRPPLEPRPPDRFLRPRKETSGPLIGASRTSLLRPSLPHFDEPQTAGVILRRWPGEACSIRAALPREIAIDMLR